MFFIGPFSHGVGGSVGGRIGEACGPRTGINGGEYWEAHENRALFRGCWFSTKADRQYARRVPEVDPISIGGFETQMAIFEEANGALSRGFVDFPKV